MEAHLRVCANVPCAHRMRGCVFRGKNEQVTQHLETCKFEALKDLLNERDKRVELLEVRVLSYLLIGKSSPDALPILVHAH